MDIKPVNMEELTEVIASTEFHPIHCNLFMYSSSKSNIKLGDMRDAALCGRHAKSMSCLSQFRICSLISLAVFEEEDPKNRSFFVRDHLINLGCEIQPRWEIHPGQGYFIVEDLGYQHGIETFENDSNP
jgi:hypothetical protein